MLNPLNFEDEIHILEGKNVNTQVKKHICIYIRNEKKKKKEEAKPVLVRVKQG